MCLQLKIKMLKVKLTTRIFMKLTNLVCKVWRVGKTEKFRYYIRDLRCQYDTEVAYKQFRKEHPTFFERKEKFNEDTREKTVHVRVGDMLLTYSWLKYRLMEDMPPLLTEPVSNMIKRNLLQETKSSHKANPVVDLEKVKAMKERQREEKGALWSQETILK